MEVRISRIFINPTYSEFIYAHYLKLKFKKISVHSLQSMSSVFQFYRHLKLGMTYILYLKQCFYIQKIPFWQNFY